MPRKRPINADVAASAAQPPAPPGPATTPSPRSEIDRTRARPGSGGRPGRRRQKPIPGALKAIAGLVVIAVVFLVAAVLGGGSANQNSGRRLSAPAPAPSGEAAKQAETPAAEAAEELGYPSFATNNTTRVGGTDPAATAAGVALAVFPSTTPAQRPAAVTLVDEASWQAAIAASVLMAAPVKAPVLLTDGSNLPTPTSQALEALDPQGSDATGKAQIFSVGDAAKPDGLRTTEVKPGNPAAVAASVAKLRDRLFSAPPQHIVLVPEGDSAIAMPAAAWAARSGDPVLFSGAKKLPHATVAALKRHAKIPVYLLGPPSSISSDVFREVAKIDRRVRRVSGKDPVENAIAFARYADGGFGWNVNDPGHGFVVARSDSPIDAALAAPLSASGTWGPLLLTDDADTLPRALREYLLDVKPGYTTDPTRAFYNHVWVIGDQEAIDVNQQAEIDQLAELARIGGEP